MTPGPTRALRESASISSFFRRSVESTRLPGEGTQPPDRPVPAPRGDAAEHDHQRRAFRSDHVTEHIRRAPLAERDGRGDVASHERRERGAGAHHR